jgi:hypothetical protein
VRTHRRRDLLVVGDGGAVDAERNVAGRLGAAAGIVHGFCTVSLGALKVLVMGRS